MSRNKTKKRWKKKKSRRWKRSGEMALPEDTKSEGAPLWRSVAVKIIFGRVPGGRRTPFLFAAFRQEANTRLESFLFLFFLFLCLGLLLTKKRFLLFDCPSERGFSEKEKKVLKRRDIEISMAELLTKFHFLDMRNFSGCRE